ncbi:NADH-ubiquinone oxidoreductase chain F [hydrothermal vent metagenome]|uniref:NADH-ubiquinone oxidoreductase chain F n=1 Tax=hydrothermal vent metagenome TaxID=652676 RepID=A0A3B1E0V7_9ZZZZ
MLSLEKRVLLPEDLKPIESLEEYKQLGGLKGLKRARKMPVEKLIAELKASGFRGRGGAGFPMAIKWDTVSKDPCPTKYVVCNFSEGEPGTYKDRYITSKNPYQLLEGMLISAHAIGACSAIIGIKEKYVYQIERLRKAIRELEKAKLVEHKFFEIVLAPNVYLFGEEKALLEVIDGRTAMPRNFPPFIMGVRYTPTSSNPTVVNNAESMCHLPHIFSKGAEWYRSLGTEDTPGTITITLSGDVKRPGMYEVEAGLTMRQMLYDLGGGPAGDKPFKAVFSGVANAVATPDLFDTVMDFGSMRAQGIGLGSAGFMVYDEDTCMVKVALTFARFLAISSCGQCLPCNMGTRIITEHLDNLENKLGSEKDIEDILIECGRCTNQTRCFLPMQASIVISSIIKKFPEEFKYHAGKECCYSKEVILPKLKSFDEDQSQFTYDPPMWEEEFSFVM